jgi:hypothetical protein
MRGARSVAALPDNRGYVQSADPRGGYPVRLLLRNGLMLASVPRCSLDQGRRDWRLRLPIRPLIAAVSALLI